MLIQNFISSEAVSELYSLALFCLSAHNYYYKTVNSSSFFFSSAEQIFFPVAAATALLDNIEHVVYVKD